MQVVFGMLKSLISLRFHELPLHIKRMLMNWKFKNKNLITELGCEMKNVSIGQHVYLGHNVVLRDSFIGDHSYINKNSTVVHTHIGKFCSIGPQVQIVLGNHPMHMVSTHPVFYSNNKSFQTFADQNYTEEYLSVEIGNDVWIGEGVLIPGGVKIGDGAIIASRAVVTRDVEPYSIVAGIPARHIRFRFESDTIEKIKSSNWWDWDEKKLKNCFKDFHDPALFVERH